MVEALIPRHITVAGKDYIVSGNFAAESQPQPMPRVPYIQGALLGHDLDLEALETHAATIVVGWPHGQQAFDKMVVTGTRHDLARGIITVRWEREDGDVDHG